MGGGGQVGKRTWRGDKDNDGKASIGVVVRFPGEIALSHQVFIGEDPQGIKQWLYRCSQLKSAPGVKSPIKPGAPNVVRVDDDALADVVSSVFPREAVDSYCEGRRMAVVFS